MNNTVEDDEKSTILDLDPLEYLMTKSKQELASALTEAVAFLPEVVVTVTDDAVVMIYDGEGYQELSYLGEYMMVGVDRFRKAVEAVAGEHGYIMQDVNNYSMRFRCKLP